MSAGEARFLRKRLRISSKEFAKLVGKTSEQYSRMENGAAKLTVTVERVVRLLYAALAQLSPGETHDVAMTQWTAELSHENGLWLAETRWVDGLCSPRLRDVQRHNH